MVILHYFLGFPPYRTGGLTKYAYDLMREQQMDGNKVCAMWPGKIEWKRRKVRIKERKRIQGLYNYELINPLPVPLNEGIVDVDMYMQKGNTDCFEDFLRRIKPDVLHIHTLMGLYKEFVDVAHLLKIRMVFTTHDYFGICPKVSLYREGSVCDDDSSCESCVMCNDTALSYNKIVLMQSPIYRIMKDTTIVKWMRIRHYNRVSANENEIGSRLCVSKSRECAEKYVLLREYYIDILLKMDIIHFNSSLTEQIYLKYFIPKKSKVISITHRGIQDNRFGVTRIKSTKLRLTMLAPAKAYKGYDVLKKALDELWEEGRRDFELNIFSKVNVIQPYMNVKANGFEQNELRDIFANTDVLVAPSVWYETFGFTVLEALSYGIPVVISNHVGAKDIVKDFGVIVEAGNVDALKNSISDLNNETIERLREKIMKCAEIKQWKQFVSENYTLYL